MKFCPSCGEKITTNSKFCKACGANLEGTQAVAEQVSVQSEKKYNGLSIAGLVLGCIAVFWTLLMIIRLGDAPAAYKSEAFVARLRGNEGAYFFGFCIGYTLLSFVSGILALIFGLRGNGKKKNGLAMAGAIMGIIAVVASIFAIIYLAAECL
jgi:hypothetical protein